jgi:hypothetical protein
MCEYIHDEKWDASSNWTTEWTEIIHEVIVDGIGIRRIFKRQITNG